MPTRRTALAGFAALAAAPAAAAPAPPLGDAERALVTRAAAWLEGLGEAQGRFVQTDARGGVSRGEVFIRRPGKARFAYAPPSSRLVVADGANVSVADPRLKTFERYPLAATPLSLFGWTVTDAQGRATRVDLQDFRAVSGLPASLFVLEDPRPRAPGRGKM